MKSPAFSDENATIDECFRTQLESTEGPNHAITPHFRLRNFAEHPRCLCSHVCADGLRRAQSIGAFGRAVQTRTFEAGAGGGFPTRNGLRDALLVDSAI